MDLRPRQRTPFSGFTKAEAERMEHLLKNATGQSFDRDFFKKLAALFNRSKGRAGKPVLKWTEVQNWFQSRQQNLSKDALDDAARKLSPLPEAGTLVKTSEDSQMLKGIHHFPRDSKHDFRDNIFMLYPNALDYLNLAMVKPLDQVGLVRGKFPGYRTTGEKVPRLSKLEFEARSTKDAAWYDIEIFLDNRFLNSGEAEVRVRYVGFGPEEDEWVNVMTSVRQRSISLEHSECHKVTVGDIVLCFQERKDVARYFEAEVVEIQRRLHDIRGCRCLFKIRYSHDKIEEKVRLRRLCFRPSILEASQKN